MHPEPTDQELEALIRALPQETWHIRIVMEYILFSAHNYNDYILPLAYVGAQVIRRSASAEEVATL